MEENNFQIVLTRGEGSGEIVVGYAEDDEKLSEDVVDNSYFTILVYETQDKDL